APIVDINLKKKNKNYKLYFINFENDKIHVMDIPMYSIQQYMFDNEDKMLFLIGNKLTTLAVINMSDYSYTELSKVEYGRNSFRFFGLIWSEGPNIYTTGYYMDEKQNATDDFIVRLEFQGQEKNIKFINTGFNLTNFKDKFNPINFVILNHQKVAFIANKGGGQYLGITDKDLSLNKVDEGQTFSSLSFSHDYILYGIKKNNKIYYSLYDYNLQKIYLQREINFPPSYNFISRDSSSIIISDLKPKSMRMDVYVGKKENDYNLKKVISDEIWGHIKISRDGKYFVYALKNGKVRVYKI
ncbi:MAG: hypothetical protein N2169_02060, partial [bacterium]|nr:hypothetical protein [bacterium]